MQQDMEKNHDVKKSNWAYPGQNFTLNVKELYFLSQIREQILNWELQEITVKCIPLLHKYTAM